MTRTTSSAPTSGYGPARGAPGRHSQALREDIDPALFLEHLLDARQCPVELGAMLALSWRPVRNMASRHQVMNASYNPWHIGNTYGLFGRITRERLEVVIEGTDDPVPSSETEWKAYEFKAKPGDVRRPPRQVAPYHLRLDWLLWFAALSPV